MKVFKLEGEEGFELAQPVADEDIALLHALIDGTPRAKGWVPVRMNIIRQEGRRSPLRRADAPWLGGDILILRQEAAETLKPFLVSQGELLPLACDQANLVVFNPSWRADALDEAASTLKRFSSGRIMRIENHVFHQHVIQGLKVFKITSLQPSPLFVNEEFVERWRAARLRGIEFRQVWED